MEPVILANVVRGETVESVHRGHLIALTPDGETIAALGDPETVTYFRSASKPFQAMPFVTSGAADAFGMTEEEIALACASHSGEPRHVELAASMLSKAGLSEADLKCGTHLPFDAAAAEALTRSGERPSQLHNNCSGKHAAMLALARHIGADTATYDLPENPVQKKILEAVSLFAGLPAEEIKIGIDGCSAPNFAMPLSAMARSFANLIDRPESFDAVVRGASRRIADAMLKHPAVIGGTGRLDTMIMQAAPGNVISKVGADGVWLAAVMPGDEYKKGFAVALKIEDGDDKRARPVVAVELLRKLGILSGRDLLEVSPMPIKSRRGEVVGRIEPHSV